MRTHRARTAPSGSDGFTLVELLTVIIIIGVLAAIAIPQFLGQKDRAYRAAMSSDLRSLVVAQLALETEGRGPTTDVALLRQHGYAVTSGVTPAHVVPTSSGWRACVTHPAVDAWLTYDAATSSYDSHDEDCAA